MHDGVDFVPMKEWKLFLVQLLNIAGTGPIFGALLLTFLPEALRFADNYRSFVYGTLLVLMVRFMPSGLIGDNSPIVNGCRKLLQRITAKKEADKA